MPIGHATSTFERLPVSTRTDIASVPVSLGARSYEVLIGPAVLGRLESEIAARFGNSAKAAVVTDANVAARHLGPVEAMLKESGRHRGTIILPPGEATKNMATLAQLCDDLLGLGV